MEYVKRLDVHYTAVIAGKTDDLKRLEIARTIARRISIEDLKTGTYSENVAVSPTEKEYIVLAFR